MLYWIGYDLDKPGQDYEHLHEALLLLGAVRILKSDWLLISDLNPRDIFLSLRPAIDATDRIMVCALKGDTYFDRLLPGDERVSALYKDAFGDGIGFVQTS